MSEELQAVNPVAETGQSVPSEAVLNSEPTVTQPQQPTQTDSRFKEFDEFFQAKFGMTSDEVGNVIKAQKSQTLQLQTLTQLKTDWGLNSTADALDVVERLKADPRVQAIPPEELAQFDNPWGLKVLYDAYGSSQPVDFIPSSGGGTAEPKEMTLDDIEKLPPDQQQRAWENYRRKRK